MTVYAATIPGIGDVGRPMMEETERIALIEKTLEELRPRIVRDGGDLKLVAVRGRDVYIKMGGACVGCQLASMTMNGIQQRLMAALRSIVRVLPAELLKDE